MLLVDQTRSRLLCQQRALWLRSESFICVVVEATTCQWLTVSFLSVLRRHQNEADVVERSASNALSDSEKSLALVRNLMNKENKVKELIGELKNT